MLKSETGKYAIQKRKVIYINMYWSTTGESKRVKEKI